MLLLRLRYHILTFVKDGSERAVLAEDCLVVAFRGMDRLIPNLAALVPRLRKTIILPGCGHWTQQERPREVNAAMLEFLASL